MAEVLQAVGGFVAVTTLLLYLFELRALRRQISETRTQADLDRQQSKAQFEELREQSRGQNAFSLVEYLEEPKHLKARAVVGGIRAKSLQDWSPEEREAADIVWRLWNISCVFQRLEVLPANFMDSFYGRSLVAHWHTLRPFVQEIRAEAGAHRARDWERLATSLQASHPEYRPAWA